MELNQILEKIVSDIKKSIINNDFSLSLYVGKTDDIERRESEHTSEGFAYTLLLAKGSYDKISYLEENLIYRLNEINICNVVNRNSKSIGNSDASCLYICIDKSYPSDDLCEYDETIILGREYPLSIM